MQTCRLLDHCVGFNAYIHLSVLGLMLYSFDLKKKKKMMKKR